MNSNCIFILIVFLLSSCGVKSKPLNKPETAIQSYTNSILDKEPEIKPTPPSK